MNKKFFLSVVAFVFTFSILAQTKTQDISSYRFDIKLNDNNNEIIVKSTVSGTSKNKTVVLNLDNAMSIHSIKNAEGDLTFSRNNDSLYISVLNNKFSFEISYSGVPKDGLIIGKNKYGNRTFFGDNWPNRAKYWLSVYDHPSDKATVEFIVTAPKKYTVVSNGNFINKTTTGTNSTYHYKTKYKIPTKVMVIGVAEFVQKDVQKAPFNIKSFVYPQDRYIALKDYSLAPQITTYYESFIGRYPFDKLYNVQSTTKYGGMENAGCIFYDENSVDGKHTNESLLAHEIAHQWFGNSVSETNWNNLWLSEGFATYLENMYMEKKYGQDTLISIMNDGRISVLNYKNKYPYKVLVPKMNYDPNAMLNAYSYQKGAWVLHMLRMEVGDKIFNKILKDFYSKYKYSNANTDDFIAIASKDSERNIKLLLEPWLYTSDLPKYEVEWKYEKGKVVGNLLQKQEGSLFINNVFIMLEYPNIKVLKEIHIKSKNQSFEFNSTTAPLNVVIDPHNYILKDI
jgi:aminopeptidase N